MLNEITVQGYFGRDPKLETRQGQNGPYKVAQFSIGVGRDLGDETDWFFCVVNGKRAEVIDKYFRKGSEIIVSGRMESYKPKKDPEHTAWILRVSGFHFTKNGTGSSSSASSAPAQADDVPDSFEQAEDDIPF